MSRTGVEEKPPWRDLPRGLRQAVDQSLGSPVVRASRIWGGYGPTPTYRLRLAGGKAAFFKGINPESNEFMVAAFARERRFYDELLPMVQQWAPRMLGSVSADGWQALLLEDLGPKSAPPWEHPLARKMMQGLAGYHLTTRGKPLPEWIPRLNAFISGTGCSWNWLDNAEHVRNSSSVAGGGAADMEAWLHSEGPRLRQSAARLLDHGVESTLLHVDLRSDNLRWRDGHLYLLDWPHYVVGAPEVDVVLFAQSITAEAGPLPESLLPGYEKDLKLDPKIVEAAIAAIVGFFAMEAWQPEIPGLPRLRRFQRRQLRASTEWAIRALGLAEAPWLTSLPESEPALP